MIAIQPLIRPLVALCVRLRINPLHIVATHALCAVAAAVLIVAGPAYWNWAAVLLLVRMLLDNIDGSVARGSGQVTLAGRFFDTGMDLITNALLFLALATVTHPLLALLAFALLMWLLSLDFNLERLYLQPRRGTRPVLDPAPEPGPTAVLVPFRLLYDLVLKPQDRLIESVELQRFRRLSGREFDQAPLDWQLAWFDLFSTASLVNLGLSTQMILLALLLLLGQPAVYVILVLFQAGLILLVQVWRGFRFRSYLQAGAADVG